MRKIVLLLLSFYSFVSIGQNIKDLSKVNIDKLSDQQVGAYWKKVQQEGKTLQELEVLARMNGVSQLQIDKLRNRILRLQSSTRTNNQKVLPIDNTVGLQQGNIFEEEILTDSTEEKRAKVFGYDFFQNQKISFTPNMNMPTPTNYIISAGDVLLVEVWGATDNSASYKVDNQGFINVNNVGKVRVGGVTFEEAKAKVNSALKRIYAGIAAPTGSYNKVYTGVSLAEVRTISVNVIGEVRAPGSYSISGLSTLLSALYASGGPTENGSFRNIILMRDNRKIAEFDVYDFLLTGSQEGNVSLQEGDVVIVPPYSSAVEVEGEVKRPGVYQLRVGEKLTDLIQFFGGYAPNAYTETLIVERIEGFKRIVKEVKRSEQVSFEMKSGDKLKVHALSNVFQNKMSIAGAVYQPGNYAYREGITIFDLIERAAGVRQEAYLERGILFRTENRVDKQAINFSVKNVLDKTENFTLKANDSIFIYDKAAITNKQKLRIAGAVRNPQTFDFVKGLFVEDLIVMAGGFIEGADATQIEISRQLNDHEFKRVSELILVSFTDDLKVSSGNVELQPNDIVNVRYKKGYTEQAMISVEGQVLFPGVYTLINKQERISDVINRAGGFTPYAFVEGATLVREKDEIEQVQEEQLKELVEITTNEKAKIKTVTKKEFRVGINLKEIMANERSPQNIYLRAGDKILIPTLTQTVEVKGSVLSPSLIRYEKNKSARSYIRGAGGFSSEARKKSVYVMYANGAVKSVRNYLFFNSYPKITPGAIVIVPEKPQRQGMTTAETVSVTTALTTLAILIYNTFKK